jgi:phytoene dehydrogenase-like protein
MKRREFLALAAALASGCRSKPARQITGSLVGASHARGHLLRGGDFPIPTATRDVAVVICGGGIAGLSAGWRLQKAGFDDFVILEIEAAAGGNSRFGENRVTPYPWGAHYIPVPSTQSTLVRELFQELGVIVGEEDGRPVYDETMLCQAPGERLLIHGKWQEGLFPRTAIPAAEQEQLQKFRAVLARYRSMSDGAGRRAFAIPMEHSSEDSETTALDRLSMREWLDREGFDSPRLRWWINYSLRDDYGCTIETTSAWAAFHYFCAREVDDPEVLTWPEGNGWIVRQLAKKLGPKIRTNALVGRIEGATVDVLEGDEAVRYRAKHVIYAMPRFTAGYVIEGYKAPAGFTYAPWVVANVTLDRLPEGTAWDNVFYDSDSLGYVVATHQSLRVAPGPSVITWYKPLTSMDPAAARAMMLTRDWGSWRDEVLEDLRRAHRDIRTIASNVDVMLWGHAMIRPVPGFLFGADRKAALAPFGPVLFAHSDMSGLSLFEEAQARGVAAADAILGAR